MENIAMQLSVNKGGLDKCAHQIITWWKTRGSSITHSKTGYKTYNNIIVQISSKVNFQKSSNKVKDSTCNLSIALGQDKSCTWIETWIHLSIHLCNETSMNSTLCEEKVMEESTHCDQRRNERKCCVPWGTQIFFNSCCSSNISNTHTPSGTQKNLYLRQADSLLKSSIKPYWGKLDPVLQQLVSYWCLSHKQTCS